MNSIKNQRGCFLFEKRILWQQFVIVLICCIGFCSFAKGQNIQLSGKISDAQTKEAIPFCTITLDDNIGTYSDIDGNYDLVATEPFDSVTVSAIGFTSQTVAISVGKQQLDFKLLASSIELAEAVVIAGENPANQIVRNIITHKKEQQIETFNNYTYETYDKLELDFVDIDSAWRARKVMQPFAYLFEHIQTNAEGRQYLPVYINEEINEIRFRQSIGKEIRSPKARQNSGIQNQSMVDYIQHFQEEIDIYDNWISIVEKPFASPLADLGLHYYEYYIIDSLNQSYQLKFKPKRKNENTFYGTFWVDTEQHAVTEIELFKSEEVNLNLINSFYLQQTFSKQKDKWLPQHKTTIFDIKPNQKLPSILAKKTTSFAKYEMHTDNIVWTEKPLSLQLDALEKPHSYWETQRHQGLADEEKAIYTMMDSLKQVSAFKIYEKVLDVLANGTKELGPIEIGPYYSLFTTNVIEGWRFKMGVFTSSKFSKQLRFGGFAAYGTKDKRLKYGGEAKWIIKDNPRTVLGASYKNDNDLNTDKDFEVSEGNMLASFLRKPLTQKLIHDKKTKVYIEKYWSMGWYTRGLFLHHNMDPFGEIMSDGAGFNYTYLEDTDNLGQQDTTITTTEISLKVRYAHKERFIDRNFSRQSLGSKYPIVSLEYTTGIKDVLQSDYDYMRFDLGIDYTLKLNPIGQTDIHFKAGKTIGNVPFLLTNVFRGNETHFYMPTAFNGMNRYEFAADQYVSFVANHHFDGFILNKIPLVKKLKWRTVASFKAAYGSLTKANQAHNQLNYFDPNRTEFIGFRAPTSMYMETGIGIENIFKIFRVDALWRLTHLDNPEAIPFSMKLGMRFRF